MARLTAVPTSGTGIVAGAATQPPIMADSNRSRSVILMASELHGVVGATDAVGDNVAYFTVNSSDHIRSIQVDAEDIGSTTAIDVGVYDAGTTDAIDADLFTSAPLVVNAAVTEQLCDFGAIVNQDRSLPLWGMLGLSADPQIEYDICITYTGEPDGDGGITLSMTYSGVA